MLGALVGDSATSCQFCAKSWRCWWAERTYTTLRDGVKMVICAHRKPRLAANADITMPRITISTEINTTHSHHCDCCGRIYVKYNAYLQCVVFFFFCLYGTLLLNNANSLRSCKSKLANWRPTERLFPFWRTGAEETPLLRALVGIRCC